MSQSAQSLALSSLLLLAVLSPVHANDACRLLTAADAEAVFGAAVEKAIDDTTSGGGVTMIRCRYRAVAQPVRYADLTVARYDSAEVFEMIIGEAEPTDEAVADLGERALWHSQSRSLSVYVGTEELHLHVFDQPERFSKDAHIRLMREILSRH